MVIIWERVSVLQELYVPLSANDGDLQRSR